MRSYQSRWHKPSKRKTDREKVYLSADEVRTVLIAQLAGRLDRQVSVHLADEEYYCPPLADAEEVIKQSALDRLTWVAERFDCDDFAVVLKAHFAEAAYKDGKRRAAHAFGIVWGEIDGGPHAVNWMINDDRVLRFVEPQTDEVFLVKCAALSTPLDAEKGEHSVAGVWFLMA